MKNRRSQTTLIATSSQLQTTMRCFLFLAIVLLANASTHASTATSSVRRQQNSNRVSAEGAVVDYVTSNSIEATAIGEVARVRKTLKGLRKTRAPKRK